MSLILLRHTTPDVAVGTCYGRTDLDVAETFEAEVSALLPGLPMTEYITSSPLRRCRHLADVIANARNQTVQIDERLIEMDFGSWEGIPWDAVSRNELDSWVMDFLHARPHGGESVFDLRERVRNALSDCKETGRSHLIVSHAGVARAALSTGDAMTDFDYALGFGQWVNLDPVRQEIS